MKKINDLKVGEYLSPCESVLLQFRITDEGVIVELADFDADIFYAFTIENRQVVRFELDEISATQKGE